ncbi:VanZ family protein [Polyangium spumosum]|uniref:VanZ family protein n=1 Tax=Polyangium spumosum TaxID=889282 RepID=A0A6N7Q353_9BACT|nr:VanZ family protein [Polyangium spumosum]MRG95341.1 VanZ family protein [Polyangium spumosum]
MSSVRAWRLALAGYVVLLGIISGLAYARGLPLSILTTPYLDKVLHFVLLGGASFLARRATNDARVTRLRLPTGPVVVGLAATIEECTQALVSSRTFDLGDLAANLLGVIVFGWLARPRV